MKNEGLLLLGKQSMEIREIEMPRITPDQVLIKTEYVGICGSDLHYYADPDKVPKLRQWQLPILLGHESAGEVVAVGENVKHLQVGDKVAVEPGVPCGECEFCRSGRYNICPSLSFMSSPPNRGAFRRYFEYPANMAYKLPDEVTTLEGCLLEPLAVGLHGAARAGVGLGDNVVIIGAGCVGLALLLACKARGAAKVILADIFDNRLAKALELGATAVINSKNEDPVAKVTQLLGGGAHVVFEAVGSPATVELCPQMLRPGGTIACIGSQPSGASYCFPAKYMIMKEPTVVMVHRYCNDYPKAIAAIAAGQIDVKAIATNIFDFEEGPQAMYQAFHNKQEITKAVIKF